MAPTHTEELMYQLVIRFGFTQRQIMQDFTVDFLMNLVNYDNINNERGTDK